MTLCGILSSPRNEPDSKLSVKLRAVHSFSHQMAPNRTVSESFSVSESFIWPSIANRPVPGHNLNLQDGGTGKFESFLDWCAVVISLERPLMAVHGNVNYQN